MLAKSRWKCLLLGGPTQLARAYQDEAAMRGLELQHYSSMEDLGYLGRMREFDAAIVHEDLAPLSGLELAEYAEKLFQSLPLVLLTSQKHEASPNESLPGSIVECFLSGEAPSGVLSCVESTLKNRPTIERESMARRLAWFL